MNIVFWHNIISEHVSPLVESLALLPSIDVYFAYEDSKQRGWKMPTFKGINVLDVRQTESYNFLLCLNASSDAHILSGYFSYPIAWSAFHSLRKTDAKILVISEAFEFLGPKGLVRLFRARLQTLIWGHGVHGILAIGNLGKRFFNMAGVSKDKLYEFCYVVETTSIERKSEEGECCDATNEFFNILYVGKLIPRKRIDLLLKAVAALSNPRICLTILGTGRRKQSLLRLSQSLDITEKVSFIGAMENEKVIDLMHNSDVLVLPSRWDGWGAVASEALMVGTPVICSNMCGVATLVEASGTGAVFKSGSTEDLTEKLIDQIGKGKVSQSKRQTLKNWSSCCSATNVSAYLLEVINSFQEVSPDKEIVPPWQSPSTFPLRH